MCGTKRRWISSVTRYRDSIHKGYNHSSLAHLSAMVGKAPHPFLLLGLNISIRKHSQTQICFFFPYWRTPLYLVIRCSRYARSLFFLVRLSESCSDRRQDGRCLYFTTEIGDWKSFFFRPWTSRRVEIGNRYLNGHFESIFVLSHPYARGHCICVSFACYFLFQWQNERSYKVKPWRSK